MIAALIAASADPFLWRRREVTAMQSMRIVAPQLEVPSDLEFQNLRGAFIARGLSPADVDAFLGANANGRTRDQLSVVISNWTHTLPLGDGH